MRKIWKMSECCVKDNCKNIGWCEDCDNYDKYNPAKTKILSPRQVEARAKRKEEKKRIKSTDASKRAKANRRAGRRAEVTLEKLLQTWGFECSRVPLSGMLKGCMLIGVPDDIFAGDLRIKINDKYRKIECKKRTNFNTFYRYVEHDVLHIKDFCYMMNELDFKNLITQEIIGDTIDTPDEKFKSLHGFFNQDNSDIVAMKSNNKPYIFAITETLMEELITHGRKEI